MFKVDILAIGAHPDDVELGCGGTLAKLIAEGKKVAILDLTQGEMGTRGNENTRRIEAENARQILGVKYRENLNLKDGFLEINQNNKLKILSVIRKYQPEIVFCNAIRDRHPDHAIASKLVSNACFLSGLPKILDGQEAWRPNQVFHYIQWENIEPNFVVDVSDYIGVKLKACLAYKTQFYKEEDEYSDEKITPIATKNFLESIEYRSKDLGRIVGVSNAEGFTTEKPLCLKSFIDIIC